MARLIDVLLFSILLVIFSTDKGESIISGIPQSVSAPSPPPFSPGLPIPATPPKSPVARAHRGVRAAYWASFTGFPASSIETSYFTHIYYAFLLPDPVTYKLDVTVFDQKKMPEFMNALRNRSPPVKLMLSIGGAGNDPNVFAKMSSSNTTRAIFIDSTIEVARNYGFDGVDLDWEFPGNDLDMLNLGWLYRQWRKALAHEANVTGKPRLLLTSAVYYAFTVQFDGPVRSYPSEAIRRYLDWISPMCFDYHGPWKNFTGPNSALFDPQSNMSTSYGIGSWIQSGVPARKVVMGVPLYGHTWTLEDPHSNGIGAPAIGKGPGDGTLTYDQILDFNSNSLNQAHVNFDNQSMTYYSYAGTSWVGYDDVGSIKLKIRFALSQGLGGYFFWALGQDRNWTISAQALKTWGN